MGFLIRWDVRDMQHQIHRMSIEVKSPHNDGWTAWSVKKDLLDLKYLIDSVIESSPEFGMEKEYFEEQSKQKTWDILNAK